MTPLTWFFEALWLAALVVELWAFVDAIRRPTPAFPAAGKQTNTTFGKVTAARDGRKMVFALKFSF